MYMQWDWMYYYMLKPTGEAVLYSGLVDLGMETIPTAFDVGQQLNQLLTKKILVLKFCLFLCLSQSSSGVTKWTGTFL